MESSVAQDKVGRFEDWFTLSQDQTVDSRAEGERARDYKDGIQLTAEEVATLKKRGQPPVVTNRIRRKVEWLKGLEVKQRTDPKAFPRTPKHEAGAESATDAIRFVCDDQDWDEVRSECYDNFIVEGYCAAEVVHKDKKDGTVDVVINHYPWDRCFYDPFSRKSDFSDARYKGLVIWVDEDDFIHEHSGSRELCEVAYGQASDNDTYDDKPANVWGDRNLKRVRLLLIWYREKTEWKWVKFIKGHILEEGDSPYKDEDGDSVCPLIMESAYIGRENDRHGPIRDMFDPQDEINKRGSKALHILNSNQTMGVKGAVSSVAAMKREKANPDGHIEFSIEAMEDAMRAGVRPLEFIPQNDKFAGEIGLLQEAKREIDLLGANSALAGEDGPSASGRAVLAKQQGGMIEIASLSDKMNRFTRTIYRHIWMRIRQYWKEERWIRVTDDEDTARFVGLNRPITLEEQLGTMDPQQAQALAMQLGLYPGDPRLGEVVGIDNNVEQLDVDIIIEEVPDRITLAGEAFEALLKYGPAIPPAVLIEADPSLPTQRKEKLLKLLQETPPDPMKAAEAEDKQASAIERQAHAQKYQAETNAIMGGF